MTTKQHVITIPAREVVPGMIWAASGHAITAVEHGKALGLDRYKLRAGDGSHIVMADDPAVLVTIPGPSPRAKLCDCSSPTTQDLYPRTAPPERHMADCPVRRLRLRVWPVGAEWAGDDDGPIWRVMLDGQRQLVDDDHILDDFSGWLQPWRDQLRTAFCLPADHSEQTDDAGWTPTAVTGQF